MLDTDVDGKIDEEEIIKLSLGKKQFGSKAALPIFAKAISKIYERGYFSYNNVQIRINPEDDWHIENYPNIIQEEICETECCLKTEYCETYIEYFIKDNYSLEECSSQLNDPLQRFQK